MSHEASSFAGSSRTGTPSGSPGQSANEHPRAPHARSRPRRADSDLIREVACGDQEAFAEIFDRYAVRVYGLVRRVVRDPSQSEVVAQRVFVEAWRTAGSYDHHTGTVAKWLLTMAHQQAIGRVRTEQAAQASQGRASDRQIMPQSDEVSERTGPTPPYESVRAALNQLTDLQRDAIALAYVRGATYRETAALLDAPPSTVRSALRDGLLRLSRART